MIKKISILVVLLFSFATVCYAKTYNYDVTLSSDKNLCNNNKISIRQGKDKIKYIIHFEVTDRDEENGKVGVKVNLETYDDREYDLVLFDDEYENDKLKNQIPKKKLKFSDDYTGTKNTKKSSRINEPFYFDAGESDDTTIMTLENLEEGGGATGIKLYIYTVEHTTKRFLFWKSHKYNIVEEEGITFNVNVKSPIIENVEADTIIEDYWNLINEIENTNFCNNPNHEPTFEQRKKYYQSQMDSLKQQLDSIIKNGNFNEWTKKHYIQEKKYMIENIDSVNIETYDCLNHTKQHVKRVRQGHWCSSCKLSLEKITDELDMILPYFYNVETENDKDEVRRKYLEGVEIMYKCAKERKDWGTSAYSETIKQLYNKIKEHSK